MNSLKLRNKNSDLYFMLLISHLVKQIFVFMIGGKFHNYVEDIKNAN